MSTPSSSRETVAHPVENDENASATGPTAAEENPPHREPNPEVVAPALPPEKLTTSPSDSTPPSGAHAATTADRAAARTDEELSVQIGADLEVVIASHSPGEAPRPTSPFVRPLPRTICLANQKGGVGKTTTAVNLGAGLAELGYRVLVVDLDPQGNATTGLGIEMASLEYSMYDVLLRDVPMEDCIEPTSVRNLFVAPSNLDLAGAEIELVPVMSRELRLRAAVADIREDFDYVLIDCPPSLGLLTVNALAGAQEVLVPIQCEYYALEGLGQLLQNVEMVQKNLNPGLEVSAIVLVMFDGRTKLAGQVADDVRAHFGARVCEVMIPRNVRLSEAPSYGQPVLTFDATSRGAHAYRDLAMEVSGGPSERPR